uniref:ATP-binding cassette sub-family A member 3-like n=1 Tax=Dermatophagoides pteronyssinus TaxID=6956 RepID=A0A6P6XLG9_DERPT|nr:ATP-binding cassette sub-family A member 3-like [Dermatophagoides pteronyssinus]
MLYMFGTTTSLCSSKDTAQCLSLGLNMFWQFSAKLFTNVLMFSLPIRIFFYMFSPISFLYQIYFKPQTEERQPLTQSSYSAFEDDSCLTGEYNEQVDPIVKSKRKAISIRNFNKSFITDGEPRKVVDNLNLDVYYSEIFALLGHNGAGKSTTIGMLTGFLTVDSGNALIAGHSLIHEAEQVRQKISICPQNNLFIDDLLVIEHLALLSSFRGVQVHEVLVKLQNLQSYQVEIYQRYAIKQKQKASGNYKDNHSDSTTWEGILEIVDRFSLFDKLFFFPHMLSGGQKRRLWLAFALIAEPSVVFLDEPTSGVDPVGRQEIWRVIQEERKSGRCIVITTHHIEEAEWLADRKAVMFDGKVRCIGSNLFLKQKFNACYYLEVQLVSNLTQRQRNEVTQNITSLLKSYIPEAELLVSIKNAGTWVASSIAAGVLTYSIPNKYVPDL